MPFRGLRYDTARVRLDDVVSPPYDILSPAEADELRHRSPCNAVHVDLPVGSAGGSPYEAAALLLRQWRDDGLLRHDEEAALYVVDQTYRGPDGFERSRRGFIGRLHLEDPTAHVVLPHEKTHRGPRADRFDLLRATHADLSPVFFLYADERGEIAAALAASQRTGDAHEILDRDGNTLRMAPVAGPAVERVCALLADRRLYIADGHHRYETALAYRDERRAAGDHSADTVMAYLCSMQDPGLTVLPTHRLVKGLRIPPMEEAVARLRPTFEVFPERGADSQTCELMAGHLASFADRGKVFGLYFPRETACVTVELRDPSAVGSLVDEGFSPAAARLSVTILHYLILRDALGIDPAGTEGHIDYVTSAAEAFARLSTGAYVLGAFINPTLVSEVREIADHHETMPQKSTYFHPKILTGLVFDDLANGA
jgi:uncharacterized protein (DUF1015 family)